MALLEGKRVGAVIREEIHRQVAQIQKNGLIPLKLVSLRVGHDSGAEWYSRAQGKSAALMGISFESIVLEADASQSRVEKAVADLSAKRDVHGIVLTLPFPGTLDLTRILSKLDPKKDIEGILPESLGLLVLRRSKLVPATALAAMALIDSTGLKVRGKIATVVGQSAIVGRPLALLLGEQRAVTLVCNTGTSQEQLKKMVGLADVLIACCGQPGLVRGEWIKEGAIVIDVGTTEVNGKLVGDVEFEAAKKKAAFITPVPGGVGPLTTLMLMRNLLTAYQWQQQCD